MAQGIELKSTDGTNDVYPSLHGTEDGAAWVTLYDAEGNQTGADHPLPVEEQSPAYDQFDLGTKLHSDDTNGLAVTAAASGTMPVAWQGQRYRIRTLVVQVKSATAGSVVTPTYYCSHDGVTWFKGAALAALPAGANDWTTATAAYDLPIYARYYRFDFAAATQNANIKAWCMGRP